VAPTDVVNLNILLAVLSGPGLDESSVEAGSIASGWPAHPGSGAVSIIVSAAAVSPGSASPLVSATAESSVEPLSSPEVSVPASSEAGVRSPGGSSVDDPHDAVRRKRTAAEA